MLGNPSEIFPEEILRPEAGPDPPSVRPSMYVPSASLFKAPLSQGQRYRHRTFSVVIGESMAR